METRLIILRYLTALSIMISIAGMLLPFISEAIVHITGWL